MMQRKYKCTNYRKTLTLLSMCCSLLLGILLSSCDLSSLSTAQSEQSSTFNGTKEPITYNTNSHDVLIRTFYGGGLSGTLEIGPQVSIYGNGTFILGLNRQGTLATNALRQLLNTLVDTYGLLGFKRQQFVDIQDQNATFLELALNGKRVELMYGSFGNQQASAQDRDEYQRLGKALTTITETLKGPIHPYSSPPNVLLVHQTFNPDYTKSIFYWPFYEFTLAQVAIYECGETPSDDTSLNQETGCLKYLIPRNAVLLNAAQLQMLKAQMNGQPQGTFTERGYYYTVTLRTLLPDESFSKTLAMFGSAQSGYRGVPLHVGSIPLPTPVV